MGKVGAFLDHGRETHGERPVEARLEDFKDISIPLDDHDQRIQASRCMMCGVAFCQTGVSFGGAKPSGCPLHNLIPEWNDLVWRGLWGEAAARMRMTNPFPEFTGRVCPAPCEAACNLGRDQGATTIKDDERAISDHEWEAGGPAPLAPDAPSAAGSVQGPTAAVVGGGPSGLAVAWELARRGVKVTVVEKADAAGGLLMYGIPNMKLPKDVVDRRIRWMSAQGIDFILETDGTDPEVSEGLLNDYDAVVLTAGAGAARSLRVPGSDLDGVVMAVDYLTASTKAVVAADGDRDAYHSAISAEGKDVVVIGGGDTGTDCVATALRQGARSVRQLEFMDRPPVERAADNPWPEWPVELKVDYGQQEAEVVEGSDPRTFAADTTELVGKDGAVEALRYRRLDWSQGRPEPIEGSGIEVPAQLVLIAMGFTGPAEGLLEAFGVAVRDDRPLPVCVAGGHEAVTGEGIDTPVFVAGDARNGASLVVTAIADGMACAREVAATLGC